MRPLRVSTKIFIYSIFTREYSSDEMCKLPLFLSQLLKRCPHLFLYNDLDITFDRKDAKKLQMSTLSVKTWYVASSWLIIICYIWIVVLCWVGKFNMFYVFLQILIIDLILHKEKVYRHLFYNMFTRETLKFEVQNICLLRSYEMPYPLN